MKQFLISKGWFPWYSEDYWCHPIKTKTTPTSDPTNGGMSLYDAYTLELGEI